MAARSVRCTLKNLSKHDLTLESAKLDWGEWSTGSSAPQKITAGAEATWSTESDGFMTGTEGTAVFTVAGLGGKFKVWWNNPFCGKNHYSQTPEPAIPNYVSYDPEHPDLGHPYLLPDGAAPHVDGSDSTVLFIFDVAEPEAQPAAETAAPAATPGASDTRVASAPTGASTTVQCPAGFRKVVYAGLTSLSAMAESKDLGSKLSADKVRLYTPTTHGWVKNDDKFKQETPLINDAKRKLLTDLENATDVSESTIAGRAAHALDNKSVRLVFLRCLAMAFAEADSDVNPNADPLSLRRLCLSAHHCPAWTNGRDDVLWGSASHDADADQILTLFKKDGNNGVLAGLAEIFPKAAEHVEDLCFSACYTGYSGCPIPAEMFKIFKNLSSVWAYEGGSPGAQNAGGNSATSSNQAIIRWENASRPCGAIDAIDTASKDLRKIFAKRGSIPKTGSTSGASIVYERSGPRKVTD